MPHLERLPTGWRWIWSEAGVRHRSHTYPTRALAEGDLPVIQARVEAARSARGPVISWQRLADLYIAHLHSQERSARYIAGARRNLEIIAERHHLNDTRGLTYTVMTGLSISHLRTARAFLRWATSAHRQPIDRAALDYRRPRRRSHSATQRPIIPADRVRLLIRAAAEWCPSAAVIAHLVATYGHRPESLVRVRLQDLVLDARPAMLNLYHVKRHRDVLRHRLTRRSITVLRALLDARISHGRQPDEHLFRSNADLPWPDGNTFSTAWYHRIGTAFAPEWPGIYELKRYAITSMIDRGLSAAQISAINGLAPATVHTYVRTGDEHQQQVIAALEERDPPT